MNQSTNVKTSIGTFKPEAECRTCEWHLFSAEWGDKVELAKAHTEATGHPTKVTQRTVWDITP